MILIRAASDIQPSEITPESVYRERRSFMQAGLALSGAALLGGVPSAHAAAETFAGLTAQSIQHRRDADRIRRRHRL